MNFLCALGEISDFCKKILSPFVKKEKKTKGTFAIYANELREKCSIYTKVLPEKFTPLKRAKSFAKPIVGSIFSIASIFLAGCRPDTSNGPGGGAHQREMSQLKALPATFPKGVHSFGDEGFLKIPKNTKKPCSRNSAPKLPELPPAFFKRVSLTLSGNVPLHHSLLELAQQVGINISLDGSIKKYNRIFYQACDQPFIQVLENLCALCALRYHFTNDTLNVCNDVPYFRTHNIQFLLGSRKTNTQTSVKTDIFASGLMGSSNKGGLDNGASIAINSASNVDFWEELERNLRLILGQNDTNRAHSEKSKQNEQGGERSVSRPPNATYSVNRYAGIVSVRATEKQHQHIARYLKQLQKLVTTQILIEAKIIEIDLTDEYKGGVNWKVFFKKGSLVPLLGSGIAGIAKKIANADGEEGESSVRFLGNKDQYTVGVETNYLQAMATFMEQFGAVRTLANPRQTVLNNQSAVLKVAHNEVFFEVQIQDYGGVFDRNRYVNQQRAQSRIQTVPIGLILYVHPSLNLETGEIIVSLHPTISRIAGTKSDPAVALSARSRGIESKIPIVQVREMDSVIVAKEGQVVVIGGLMEERSGRNVTGIPGLSKVPVFGELFKHRTDHTQKTELVIFLTLSVLSPEGSDGVECTKEQERQSFRTENACST